MATNHSGAPVKRSSLFWTIVGVLSVGVLGVLDYLTGFELSFSLFYLAPIALLTWRTHRTLGLLLSLLSAVTWLAADLAAGHNYSHAAIYFWNTLIRFGFFVIVTYLLAELRRSHVELEARAHTDPVSGALNARSFEEQVELEIERFRRQPHPFTVAYLDIDNFKSVNDSLGHARGNQLIQLVASQLALRLRTTDRVARIGGDEFALLMPATGPADARGIISRLHADLTSLLQLESHPITFSMGVITCTAAPGSAQRLIDMADTFMYTIKKSTKNNVRFATYPVDTADFETVKRAPRD